MENRSKSDKIFKIIHIALVAAELIAVVCFFVMLIILNMLPPFLMVVICIILLGITAGTFFLGWKKSKNGNILSNRVRKIIASAIALIMAVLLALGSYLIYMANHVIVSVTNDGMISKTYKMVVLQDDPADSIQEASDYIWGSVKDVNEIYFLNVQDYLQINDGVSLNSTEFPSAKTAIDAFYDGKVQGLIYDNSLDSLFNEFKDTFATDVKVIKEFSVFINETEIETFVPETTTAEPVVSSSNIKPFTVLLSGSDEYFELSANGRSDVNMLAVVNFDTRQVLLASIPRDYYVEFPGVTEGQRDKLTHAGIYGIDTLCNSISNCFNISIDYYCRVNFTSVVDIIDAIGGIMIDNPYEFRGYDNGMLFQQGVAWYNGYWALQFMRERKGLEGGDLARGQHQQLVLEAMINKLTSAASLTNFNALIAAIEKGAIMNIPEDFIKEIVRTQLAEGGSWKVLKVQALGDEVYQPSYAMDGMVVSVVMPYKESVEYVSEQIRKVYSGQLISDIHEGEPTELNYITDLIDCD